MRINCENAVPMLNLDDLKGHSICTVNGIFGTAGRAEPAFTSKWNKFEFSAFFTGIHSTAEGAISAVNQFVNIFHYDRSRFNDILYVFVMVCKYLLKNVHV